MALALLGKCSKMDHICVDLTVVEINSDASDADYIKCSPRHECTINFFIRTTPDTQQGPNKN